MTPESAPEQPPLASPFAGLQKLANKLKQLDDQLEELGNAHDRKTLTSIRKLRKSMRDFEPSVTMLGQVKAGKTTLVNAMVGWPNLLPADVNPWTSVVTSLHLQPRMRADERRAAFRFFTNDEWEHLIRQGGRVGEMANRAGAEEELEKVRKQLDEMRAKSQKRLGRRFQMLLGQTHDYECFDEELIQRYVCMGDDFWEDAGSSREQGRFADITKSADLWFAKPDLPLGLCIRDTPGVNDTFMIREQITINALRSSRLCVMVLSAQQALSAVDLGLIRLIANVKSRDVIIFVNRIDELANPAIDVPAIRDSITATLRKFDGPEDAEIIFGSGYWAEQAISGSFDAFEEESAEAMLDWAEAQLDETHKDLSPRDVIWHLSGLPKLGATIAARIENDSGAKMLALAENGVSNLNASFAAQSHDPKKLGVCAFDQVEVARRFDEIHRRSAAALEGQLAKAENACTSRIEKAHLTFLDRATSSLVQHLENYGEDVVWTYDPSGLRMLLRSAFQVFARNAARSSAEIYEIAAREMNMVYKDGFGLGDDVTVIQAPPQPSPRPPVALGQTIALDLKGGWWTRFWRKRRGYQAFFDDFSTLIHEETLPIVTALKRDNAEAFSAVLREDLANFIATQRETLSSMAALPPADPDAFEFVSPKPRRRAAIGLNTTFLGSAQ